MLLIIVWLLTSRRWKKCRFGTWWHDWASREGLCRLSRRKPPCFAAWWCASVDTCSGTSWPMCSTPFRWSIDQKGLGCRLNRSLCLCLVIKGTPNDQRTQIKRDSWHVKCFVFSLIGVMYRSFLFPFFCFRFCFLVCFLYKTPQL